MTGTPGWTVLAVAVVSVAAVVGSGSPAARGAGGSASSGGVTDDPTLVNATVTVDVDDPRVVTATYRFRVPDGDPPSAIRGTIWRIPGRDVHLRSASVDGEPVDPEVARNGSVAHLSVPVQGATGSVVVRVRYAVTGPSGELRLPLWVPEFGTAGSDRVVGLTVRLPEGTTLRGSAFPAVDTRDDATTLRFRLLHVPGLVFLRYGDRSPVVTPTRALRLAGLFAVAGSVAAWVAVRRRRADRGGSA